MKQGATPAASRQGLPSGRTGEQAGERNNSTVRGAVQAFKTACQQHSIVWASRKRQVVS